MDRYLALTDAIAEHLRGYGIPAERIVVKPNSVPDPGEPAPLGAGFLFLGRLTEEKGVHLLLDAWQRHPDGALGTLTVVGDGPLRPLVEQAATARSDLDFRGPQDRAGVAAALRAAAVVLATSTWYDVLPTVILEALAAGRPVLGTDLGGIPYLIGDAGWVVPAQPDALAGALATAHVEAAELAPRARQRYLGTFTPELITKRLLDVYTELADRPASR